MDELLLIETVERYLKGEMTPKERIFFEEIRKNNPAIDQLVVEHTFLYHELDKQANIKAFKHSLYEVENKLTEEGKQVYGQYPSLGKAAKGFITGSKLVELDNVGHIPHVQDHPAFERAVENFLKE